MGAFQTAITIDDVLEKIESRRLMLPSFQREYVWAEDKIYGLMDSLMKGYPFSSMLFWKVEGEIKKHQKYHSFVKGFRERYNTFEKAESMEEQPDFHAVMDGQQRLTSIYIAFRGSYAKKVHRKNWNDNEDALPTRKLYLNLTKRTDEDNYEFKFFTKDETSGFSKVITKNADNWFLVAYSKEFDAFNLRRFTGTDDIKLNDKELDVLANLVDMRKKQIINFYEETSTNYEEAVNIFVRVNSGGVSLTYSDIMFSMVVAAWDGKIDAKEDFKKLQENIDNLGFSISNDFILKAILFLFHKEIKFNLGALNKDFLQELIPLWENIKGKLLELFGLLQVLGFNFKSLTSYNAVIPILYYLYYSNFKNFEIAKGYEKERSEIKKWLLMVLIGRVFGGSSDGILAKVRKVFTDNTDTFKFDLSKFSFLELNKSISDNMTIDTDAILNIQKNDRRAFSILALLYPNLDYKNGNFERDHLHPESAFESSNVEWLIYNSIINLQFLDKNENSSKQDMPLEDWVNRVKEKGATYNDNLDLIPTNVSLKIEDATSFFEERKELLKNKLESLLK